MNATPPDHLGSDEQIADEREQVAAGGLLAAAVARFATLVCDLADHPDAVAASARMLRSAAHAAAGEDLDALALWQECGPVARAVMMLQAYDLAQNHAELDAVAALLRTVVRLGEQDTALLPVVLLPAGHPAVRVDDEHAVAQPATLPAGYVRTLRTCAQQLQLPRPQGLGRITALTHLLSAAAATDDDAQLETLEATVRLAAACFLAGGHGTADTVRTLHSEADGWTLRNLEP